MKQQKTDWVFPVYDFTLKQHRAFRIPNIFIGEYLEAFEKFIKYYVPDVIVSQAEKHPQLKPRAERECRFCKNPIGETTFKSDAHVIPQCLGNKFLIQDNECDDCNSLFSKYETSLASYIGLQRTTDLIKGQAGIPKYKNPDKTITVSAIKGEKGEDVISLDIIGSKDATYSSEEKTVTFSVPKMTYVPLHVMKSLYKIGYSLLPDDEVHEYRHIEKILMSTDYDDKLYEYCKVRKFTFPFKTLSTFTLTFKRREEYNSMNIPKKIVLIYFGRFAYEFILLNSEDRFMIQKGGTGQIFFCPPYWDLNNGTPDQQEVDLSSPNPRNDDVEQFKFTFTESHTKE